MFKLFPQIQEIEDTSLERRMMKFNEIIKGLHTKIEELSQAPITTPKVRAKCEKIVERDNSAFENIKTMDLECTNLHEESAKLWIVLIENEKLKEVNHKL